MYTQLYLNTYCSNKVFYEQRSLIFTLCTVSVCLFVYMILLVICLFLFYFISSFLFLFILLTHWFCFRRRCCCCCCFCYFSCFQCVFFFVKVCLIRLAIDQNKCHDYNRFLFIFFLYLPVLWLLLLLLFALSFCFLFLRFTSEHVQFCFVYLNKHIFGKKKKNEFFCTH